MAPPCQTPYRPRQNQRYLVAVSPFVTTLICCFQHFRTTCALYLPQLMQVLSFSRDNFLTVRLQPPLSHGKSRPVAPSLVECLAHLELAIWDQTSSPSYSSTSHDSCRLSPFLDLITPSSPELTVYMCLLTLKYPGGLLDLKRTGYIRSLLYHSFIPTSRLLQWIEFKHDNHCRVNLRITSISSSASRSVAVHVSTPNSEENRIPSLLTEAGGRKQLSLRLEFR